MLWLCFLVVVWFVCMLCFCFVGGILVADVDGISMIVTVLVGCLLCYFEVLCFGFS